MRQILSRTGDLDGEPLVVWRSRDLGRHGGMLIARRAGRYVGVPVRADRPDGPGRVRVPVEAFRERPPEAAVRGSVVLVAEDSFRARFANLAGALGAAVQTPPSLPDQPGTPSASADAQRAKDALREATGARLHLLVGMLNVRRSSVEVDALKLRDGLELLVAHEGHGPDPASGLARGQLAFAMEAWRRAITRERPIAEILARGLAELVGATTYTRDFRFALSAPEDEVIASLAEDGVSIDQLVQEIEVLAQERAHRSWRRAQRFSEAIAPLLVGLDAAVVTDLREQALEGVTGVALRVWSCQLSRAVGASWIFAPDAEWYRAVVDLAGAGTIEHLDVTAGRSLARLCALGALDDSNNDLGLAEAITAVESRWIAIRDVDWWSPFTVVLARLGLRERNFVTTDGTLVGATDETWLSLENAATEAIRGHERLIPGLAALVSADDMAQMLCTLRVLTADASRTAAAVRATWLGSVLEPAGPPLNTGDLEPVPVSENSAGGTGGGGAGDPLRGDAAEAAMLRWSWQRFLALGLEEKGRVLDAIATRRNDGGPLWSTNAGREGAKRSLDDHRDRLLAATAESGPPDEAFLALVNVASERGPGFDMIDWRDPPWREGEVPVIRVEVKGVVSRTAATFRVTSNEFHKACVDGQSYVLRVVEIVDPKVPLATLLRDIKDPVGAFGWREKFAAAVRGGHAAFRA